MCICIYISLSLSFKGVLELEEPARGVTVRSASPDWLNLTSAPLDHGAEEPVGSCHASLSWVAVKELGLSYHSRDFS